MGAGDAAAKRWATDTTHPSLIVIDSVGAAGGHSNHADEYIEWHHKVITPFVKAGCAVLGIDHNTRSKQTQADRAQHGALGTVVKSNEADLIYEARPSPQMFSPYTDGFAPLMLRKDRLGVWQTRVDRTVARLNVKHQPVMTLEFLNVEAGSQHDIADTPSTEQIAGWMLTQLEECRASGSEVTANALKSMMWHGTATEKNAAVKHLTESGQVIVKRDGTLSLPDPVGDF